MYKFKTHIRIIIFFMLLASTSACGQKKTIPKSLIGVKETVAKLDSAVTAMYGWEPRDSTYNASVDTLVADLMNQCEEECPDVKHGKRTVHAIEQDAYDEARVTWAKFKKLCDADEYEKALDVYLGEGDDYIKKNSGDFLVFLKHSTQRFIFFSQVLLPLMREYRGEEYAVNDYINNLQLEKALSDATIAMSAETTGYIPEAYPYVIKELGSALVSVGKMDEAQDLFDDYINAIYSQTGDALYANFAGTYYTAHLYLLDDKPDWALGTWDNFKEYLEEYKADYPPEELAICLKKIDEEMSKITSRVINVE